MTGARCGQPVRSHSTRPRAAWPWLQPPASVDRSMVVRRSRAPKRGSRTSIVSVAGDAHGVWAASGSCCVLGRDPWAGAEANLSLDRASTPPRRPVPVRESVILKLDELSDLGLRSLQRTSSAGLWTSEAPREGTFLSALAGLATAEGCGRRSAGSSWCCCCAIFEFWEKSSSRDGQDYY